MTPFPSQASSPQGLPPTSTEVIRFFLGENVKADDPRSLLGISPGTPLTDAGIVAALQQRLSALTSHPQSAASQAGQIRFLLHSAATQLFEAAAASRGTTAIATGSGRPDLLLSSQTHQRFISDLKALIIQCGGWNTIAMQRASTVAALHSKDMSDVTAALATIMQADPSSTPQGHTGPVGNSNPFVTNSNPAVRLQLAVPSVMDPPREFAAKTSGLQRPSSPQSSDAPEQIREDDPAKRLVMGLAAALAAVLVGLMAVGAVIIISSQQSTSTGDSLATDLKGSAPTDTSANVAPSTPTPTEARLSNEADATTSAHTDTLKHAKSLQGPSESTQITNSRINAEGRVLEWPDVVASMEATAESFRTRAPGAGDRFRSTYRGLATQWSSVREDARKAGVNAVLEALFIAINDTDQISTVLNTFDENLHSLIRVAPQIKSDPSPEDIDAAVFTAGIIARLSNTTDVPASARSQLTSLSKSFFGDNGSPQESSFEAGAGRALTVIAAWIISLPATAEKATLDARTKFWERWLASAKSVRGQESDFYVRSLLNALDQMVGARQEPTQNQALFDSMSTVAVALPWRTSDATRAWLMRQFDMPQASNSDLHVLTLSLALKSGAPGIDPTMVLPVAANESARAALRDTYANIWNIADTSTKQEAFASWLAAVKDELSKSSQARVPMQDGIDALIAARLHLGAALLWAGPSADQNGAPVVVSQVVKSIIDDLDLGLTNKYNIAVTRAANLNTTLLAASTQWSTAYKNVGTSAPQRIQLLSQFPATPTMVEAQIVVEEAIRGSNERVQALAISAVKTRFDDPAIVNAMLDASVLMPQTNSNTELIRTLCPSSTVPMPRDPGWRVAVRRALTERLLELIAGRGELAVADELALAYAQTYWSISQINISADETPSEPAAATPGSNKASDEENTGTVTYYSSSNSVPSKSVSPEDACSMLISRLYSQAQALVPSGKEPLSLARIAASRLAREKLAVGKVQRFAALQLCLFELYSFIIANEQPRASSIISRLHDQLILDREAQEHVLGQIRVVEHAILQLWLIRHGSSDIAVPDALPVVPNAPAKSGSGAAS